MINLMVNIKSGQKHMLKLMKSSTMQKISGLECVILLQHVLYLKQCLDHLFIQWKSYFLSMINFIAGVKIEHSLVNNSMRILKYCQILF